MKVKRSLPSFPTTSGAREPAQNPAQSRAGPQYQQHLNPTSQAPTRAQMITMLYMHLPSNEYRLTDTSCIIYQGVLIMIAMI